MQPTFPRKNWALNTLIEFREASTIFEFTDYFQKNENEENNWNKENLEFQINHLINLFDGLKEETNQIMHTSNTLTVTTFFEEVINDIDSWNLNKVEKEYFTEISREWNNSKYREFLEEVEKKENEYFNAPERIKYRHLEEYKTFQFSWLDRKSREVTIVNKNFYCVEEIPKLIDLKHLDKYLKILLEITAKFQKSISQELNLYQEGKLIPKSQLEKTHFEKISDKFKNNKLVTGVLIGFIIYGGISSIIKLTKENQDNLYGKDGLLNKAKSIDTIKQKDNKKINYDSIKKSVKSNIKKIK
ncbi:hypothetical protein NU08_1614 [Flavobacterium anhuiense]|uniref:Uncharacterized protein n=1 Tax=Flavobacterium anhuiense TaxID=459526 RepID=A0A444W0R5_9FLAO|nr:hypothetical protein [Flavobacterium anhuiense]RYJ39306.1 hypothetical protein NU08_1614 [Flavobacterium anhuiense]